MSQITDVYKCSHVRGKVHHFHISTKLLEKSRICRNIEIKNMQFLTLLQNGDIEMKNAYFSVFHVKPLEKLLIYRGSEC